MGLAYSTPGAWLDQYDAHLFHEHVRRHTPSTAADEPGGTAVPATEAMGGGASAGSGSAGGAPGTAHPDASHSTSDLPTALEDRRGPSGVGTSADSNISGDDDDDWLFSRPAAPSFPRQPRLVSATLQVRRHNHTAHQRELSIEVQRRGQGTQKLRYPLHLSCSHATEFLWKAAQVRCPEVRALHMYHVGEHAWTCVITRSRDCCRQRWRQHATPPRAGMSCNLASAWHMWCRLGTGDPRCGLRWTGVVIAACRPRACCGFMIACRSRCHSAHVTAHNVAARLAMRCRYLDGDRSGALPLYELAAELGCVLSRQLPCVALPS